jgi:hypothetical protein
VLKITESRRPKGDKRGGYDATAHADLWVGFVEARNTYKVLCEKKAAKAADLESVQEKMKSAYRAWSEI